jgi:hypothetical protein
MSIVRRSERIEKVPDRSGWIVAYPDWTAFLGITSGWAVIRRELYPDYVREADFPRVL